MPHLVEFTHVGQQDGNLGLRDRIANLGRRALRPIVSPGCEDHLGPERGEPFGRGQPESRGRPGHQHDLGVHPRRRSPTGHASAQCRSERREAGDHRRLEQFVDGRGHKRPRLRVVPRHGRCSERLAQTLRALVPNPVEKQSEERIGQREGSLERQVCLVGENRPTVRRGHDGHGVLGAHGVGLTEQHDPVWPFVRRDLVIERSGPRPDPDVEPEGTPEPDFAGGEALRRSRARIPFGGVGEVCHVVKGLLGRTGREDGSPVTGHGDTPGDIRWAVTFRCAGRPVASSNIPSNGALSIGTGALRVPGRCCLERTPGPRWTKWP